MAERPIDPLTGEPYKAAPGDFQFFGGTPAGRVVETVAEGAVAVEGAVAEGVRTVTGGALVLPRPLGWATAILPGSYESFGSSQAQKWTKAAHEEWTSRGEPGTLGSYITAYVKARLMEKWKKLPADRRQAAMAAYDSARSRAARLTGNAPPSREVMLASDFSAATWASLKPAIAARHPEWLEFDWSNDPAVRAVSQRSGAGAGFKEALRIAAAKGETRVCWLGARYTTDGEAMYEPC